VLMLGMVKSSFFRSIERCVKFISKINGSPALCDLVQGDHVPVRAVRCAALAGDLIGASMAALISAISPAAFVADSAVGDGLNGLEL
jgi:hypothetical protein